MSSRRCAQKTAVGAAVAVAALMSGGLGVAETLSDITKDIRFEPGKITVSGVSSGAYMAVQFHVAHSQLVEGVGAIAGGPYLCARHTIPRLHSKPPLEGIDGRNAGFICSHAWVGPWYADQHYLAGKTGGIFGSPDVPGSIAETLQLYAQRKIDNPSNIRADRVWLYSGGGNIDSVATPRDFVVPLHVVQSLGTFYKNFGADVRMPDSARDHPAAHSMVVDNDAKQCTTLTKSPPEVLPPFSCVNGCGVFGGAYINNCNYDAAGELLKFLYKLSPEGRGTANAANLHRFEQAEFGEVGTDVGLSPLGHVYVPSKCASKEATCKLHVALHGCAQSFDADVAPDFVTFYRNGGYNEWAEANNIVILYPQLAQSPLQKNPPKLAIAKASPNPTACWDWWGHENDKDYPTKDGRQIKSLKAMVDTVLHRSS